MPRLALGLGLNIGWMSDDDEDGSMSVLAGSGMSVLTGTDKPVLSCNLEFEGSMQSGIMG